MRTGTIGERMPTARATVTSLFATFLLAATLCAFGCAGSEPEQRLVPDAASRRVTHSGEVEGGQSRYNSHAWLGIPYAKPPLGALRWRAPQPPESWTGTREALTVGSPCTQFSSRLGGVNK